MEDHAGKANRNKDAELVNRCHGVNGPLFKGLVIAEPGGPGRNAGQEDKVQLPFGQAAYKALLPLCLLYTSDAADD